VIFSYFFRIFSELQRTGFRAAFTERKQKTPAEFFHIFSGTYYTKKIQFYSTIMMLPEKIKKFLQLFQRFFRRNAVFPVVSRNPEKF